MQKWYRELPMEQEPELWTDQTVTHQPTVLSISTITESCPMDKHHDDLALLQGICLPEKTPIGSPASRAPSSLEKWYGSSMLTFVAHIVWIKPSQNKPWRPCWPYFTLLWFLHFLCYLNSLCLDILETYSLRSQFHSAPADIPSWCHLLLSVQITYSRWYHFLPNCRWQ